MESSAKDRSTNVVVLLGTVTSEPARRELPGGRVVVQFDLATQLDDAGRPATVSVPLAWHDPTAAALASVVLDARLAVIGSVRRRFFRSGGVTQSRTEVVVDQLVPAKRAKSVRSAVVATATALTQVVG